MKKIFIFLIALCASSVAIAQKGTVRGKIIDNATGEPLIGSTIVVEGTSTGSATDLDGQFSFQIDPGTYNVQASFISYETQTISNVVVKAGEVTLLGTIRLGEAVSQLNEVVITAEVVRETEAALLTVKRKSPNLIDGISSETFKKIGDSNAAGAIKRVPGVSVQGGQYVFVRGLGDRYTKTTLNSMEIPGLDPDRNSVQMDIFPTNLINNIVVFKSFTPDLAADFVGGTVDVELKDFPEEKTITLSGSINFNPSMHFQSGFLTYDGSSTDFLGFDNGKRDLPFDPRNEGSLPNPSFQIPATINKLAEVTRRFDPVMAATRNSNLPDGSISLAVGNQFDKPSYNLGYNVAVNYSNSSQFFEEAVDAAYVKPNQSDETRLIADTRFRGPLATRDVQLSGLGGLSLKTDKSKYSLKLLRIQNGTERAAQRTRVRSNNNFNTSFVDNLEYTERQVNNATLSGKHSFTASKTTLDWKVAGTFMRIDDKDVRATPFTEEEDGSLTINAQEGGDPFRIWRLLDEQNFSGRLDYEKGFDFAGNKSKFKAGVSSLFKQRDYEIQDFFIDIFANTNVPLNGDPDRLLIDENIINPVEGGAYISSSFQANNAYEGRIQNLAAYVSGELALSDKLKTVVGVRAENYDQYFTGQNQQGDRVFDDENVLSSLKFFPSLNFTYSYSESANIRASFSQTVARPSFKEKSTVEIQDVLTGRTFIGNIDLVETDINNFDLRWEYFFKRGQTVSLGAFYKTFKNPIEMVRQSAEPNNIKPTNVGDAEIFGVELEVRKDLSFISSFWSNFSVKGNLTLTQAQVEIDSIEAVGRMNGLRDGESFEDTRDFVGQPPYIVNLSLDYLSFENGFEASASYNVQGPTLFFVGVNRTPDTFTVPFHSLNFNINKSFGAENKNKIGLRITNILGDVREREFQSFGSDDQFEFVRDPGTAFRIKFSRTF